MFVIALGTNKPDDAIPVNHGDVDRDVEALYKAGQGKVGTDQVRETTEGVASSRTLNRLKQVTFCEILINRSHPHLIAV